MTTPFWRQLYREDIESVVICINILIEIMIVFFFKNTFINDNVFLLFYHLVHNILNEQELTMFKKH